MPRERTIVRQISDYLDNLDNCWYFKVHGSIYQKAGIPDLLGVYRGIFFAIEVKNEQGKTTKLQDITLERIRKAGGLSFVARSAEEVAQEFAKDIPYRI